jgi:hypothetical protein
MNIEGKWVLKNLYRKRNENTIEEIKTAAGLDKGDEVYFSEIDGDFYKGKRYKSYLLYDNEERNSNERILKPLEIYTEGDFMTFVSWGILFVFQKISE